MSLLMEALKKAERAKQGQTVIPANQSSQPGGATETPNLAAAPSPGLSLLPQERAAEHVDMAGNSDFPPITAFMDTPASIPDLAPLTIESQNTVPARVEPTISALEPTRDAYDLSSASANKKSESPCGEPASASPALLATPGIEPEPQPAASPKLGTPNPPALHTEAHPESLPQDAKKIAAAQQKAKTVFSARQPARSRTLLFAGTAAAVVLGLAGFGIYYWQITSTGTMAIPANSPPPTSASVPANPVDTGAPQQQDTPAASVQNPIDEPALSPAKACPEPCRREPAPATAQASPPAVPTSADPARVEARSGSESFKENPAIRIRQSAATNQLNPTLGKAYQSFLSGDTGTAQQQYQKVLQQEPNNRDALLGLAAIALKQKQAGQAVAYYGKLLDLDPADPEALAALIGLQGQTDPTQSESRLKKVLLQNPQADAAHFALGNLYAQQSRWAEAQQSYFRAYGSAPGNADYAFNLAVSLDHLNQGKLALDYYQRALAQPGPANFDKLSVQTRIKELMPQVEK